MIGVWVLFLLALVWIIFATIQDLRSREVANWINFSLIIFALGFRFFYGMFSNYNFNLFYQGLIGLGIFFVLGNLFYYARLFAGGDAKLMIALGTILPFSETFATNVRIFSWFFLIFFFVGALYGLIWSFILMIKNFGKFKKEFVKQFRLRKILISMSMILGLILIVVGFYDELFLYFGVLIFLLPYFYVYAKSVDEVCMVKEISVKKLREGDWLYKDLKVGSKVFRAKWKGLENKQIKEIQKKFKKVSIREGIPFVPVFLISFILLMIVWKFTDLFGMFFVF
jgi:Flp pilus assembly protein protease CpaA